MRSQRSQRERSGSDQGGLGPGRSAAAANAGRTRPGCCETRLRVGVPHRWAPDVRAERPRRSERGSRRQAQSCSSSAGGCKPRRKSAESARKVSVRAAPHCCARGERARSTMERNTSPSSSMRARCLGLSPARASGVKRRPGMSGSRSFVQIHHLTARSLNHQRSSSDHRSD